MHDILLINPNSSEATTRMMVDIAQAAAAADYMVRGGTSRNGPPMITKSHELAAAAPEVMATWEREHEGALGVIISAYGDPGIERLRKLTDRPVVGICEASMIEAAAGGRRFGIATVTPDLVEDIDANARLLGLADVYTGIRLTPGDPRALAARPEALVEALGDAVAACIELDGAQAVIIGGGPLGQAAEALAGRFAVPVIAPIPSAMRRLMSLLEGTSTPHLGSATVP